MGSHYLLPATASHMASRRASRSICPAPLQVRTQLILTMARPVLLQMMRAVMRWQAGRDSILSLIPLLCRRRILAQRHRLLIEALEKAMPIQSHRL